ncbi:MAG TPA: GMC oxidoreductase, partial [Acetobacteraceae bacterium]
TYRDGENREYQARTDGKVILAAGSLVTPQLLMLSGVGPADQLRSHGITPVADLPGVGEHLVDHPEVPMIATANGLHGYYKQGVGWRMIRNGLRFKLFGAGPILSAGVEAGAFVNPADPGNMPLVSPNLLQHPADVQTMIAGQRFFLRAFATSPLKERIRAVAIPDPTDPGDEAILRHCKRFVKTNYHPAGTCRTGPPGYGMAVLDSRLRVRGIEHLRVCDLSAMPDINAGNTNAPAMMLGSRCAEFISGKAEAHPLGPPG